MCVPHHPRRLPGGVLGGEEAVELLVVEVDAEAAEELADHLRILDLVDRAGTEEQRQVVLPEDRRRLVRPRQVVALERGEPGPPARLEKLLVVGEVEERVPPVEEHGAQHAPEDRVAAPWCAAFSYALLALGPLVILADSFTDVGDIALFVLAALALIPLAWLIGEATEHAAHHTGPGIGGFLNATFGNAPELIIALIAVNTGPHRGRARLARPAAWSETSCSCSGSRSLFGGEGRLDRESSLISFALVAFAVAPLPHPVDPGLGGRPRPALARRPLRAGVDRAARRLRGRHLVLASSPSARCTSPTRRPRRPPGPSPARSSCSRRRPS